MVRKSFWTTLASLAFAVNSLVVNKMFSIFFGPQGVTLLAHFQNIIAIFTTIPNDGINRGVIKYLSNTNADAKYWNHYFSSALLLNIASFIATLILVISFSTIYVKDFPAELFESGNVIILVAGVFFHFISLFLISYIMAIGHIVAYSVFSIINNIIGLGLIYFGALKGFTSALLFLSAYPVIIVFAMAFYLVKKQVHRWQSFRFSVNKPALKDISQFIFIALSGVVFGRLVDFFIRDIAISEFNLYQTGLWQGVVKISDGYSSVFNAAFGMLFFVKISSLLHQKVELKTFTWKALAFVTVLSMAGLSVIYFFKTWFLMALYNPDFSKASGLMDFQLLGDMAKFPSWILGYILLSQVRTKTYIATQALSAFLYCFFVWLLIPVFGIEGLPIAHFIRFVIYLIVLVYLNKQILFGK